MDNTARDQFGPLENSQDHNDSCYHGGAFFKAIGEGFDDLQRRHQVINADVLDAWFPPAPSVTRAIEEHLPWLVRTSPPTHSGGLIEKLSRRRNVPKACILPGAGSSDLIFLALREWLRPGSRVLMFDPSYGEYGHICEDVIGCQVDRIVLERSDDYRIDLEQLTRQIQGNYELVILINPNNPSGQYIEKNDLEEVLRRLPAGTRCWLDEAYIEYTGSGNSLESFAATSENVYVCKSLSKVYALSGMRAAYLIGNPKEISRLRQLTPPWAVSLPAQLAAVRALDDASYYAARYVETRALRHQLSEALQALSHGGNVIEGVGNWVIWYPPLTSLTVTDIVERCREQNVYLREFADPQRQPGIDAIRISVKDPTTQAQLIRIVSAACNFSGG